MDYDQTGFIKGRFIGENIRLIDSVICYAKEKNIPGLLLFLDFEKAFDTIEWPFIRKTFQYFGFGSSILKWLNLFYCRPELTVGKIEIISTRGRNFKWPKYKVRP